MRYILSIIALTLILASCSNKQDHNVISKNFTNEEWPRFDYLNGEIDIKDAPAKYDIVMEVVLSEIYPNAYENSRNDCSLKFNMTIKNPNDNGARSRDYNYNLKDRDGNWKADKKDGYYTFKLPIISGMTFVDDGIYQFKIENIVADLNTILNDNVVIVLQARKDRNKVSPLIKEIVEDYVYTILTDKVLTAVLGNKVSID